MAQHHLPPVEYDEPDRPRTPAAVVAVIAFMAVTGRDRTDRPAETNPVPALSDR